MDDIRKNRLAERLCSFSSYIYLDREDQAERDKPMYMKDWIEKLNAFLQFNGRGILENAGKISSKVAEQLAVQEYEKFNQNRLVKNVDSDFDDFIKRNRLK